MLQAGTVSPPWSALPCAAGVRLARARPWYIANWLHAMEMGEKRDGPPSKRPALPDPLMGGVKPTNLAKVGLTLSDS